MNPNHDAEALAQKNPPVFDNTQQQIKGGLAPGLGHWFYATFDDVVFTDLIPYRKQAIEAYYRGYLVYYNAWNNKNFTVFFQWEETKKVHHSGYISYTYTLEAFLSPAPGNPKYGAMQQKLSLNDVQSLSMGRSIDPPTPPPPPPPSM